MKKVLAINLGWEQEPLLDYLSSIGVQIYGIHYDNSYYKKPRYKDVLVCDVRDLDSIIKYADKVKPDAVISDQCDYSYFAQSLIAEKFGLPGAKVSEAQLATNKFLQREKCKGKGVLIPKYRLCSSVDEIKSFAKEIGFPIIIKPLDNRGSFGVIKVEKEKEIESAFFGSIIHSHSRLVLAEEFIDGVHITVDGYVFQGIGAKSLSLATKKLLSRDMQVAMEIIYPGELPQKIYDKAMSVNEDVCGKLGFSFGMIHAEYMIRGEDIYLIEVANRGGGCYTSEIIAPHVSGIDLVEQYVSDCLVVKKECFKPIEKNRVLLKFFRFKEGVVKKINIPKSFAKNKNLLKYRMLIKKGAAIKPITSDAGRHGFVILKEKDNIHKEADALIKEIEVEYEK